MIVSSRDISQHRYPKDDIVRLLSSVRYIGVVTADNYRNSYLPLMYYHAEFLQTLFTLISDIEKAIEFVESKLDIDRYLENLGRTGNLYNYVTDKLICKNPNEIRLEKNKYCVGHSSSSDTLNLIKCIKSRKEELLDCYSPENWDIGHDFTISVMLLNCEEGCLILPHNYNELMSKYIDALSRFVDIKYYINYKGRITPNNMKYYTNSSRDDELCNYKYGYVCSKNGNNLVRSKQIQKSKNYQWCPDKDPIILDGTSNCNIINDEVPFDDLENLGLGTPAPVINVPVPSPVSVTYVPEPAPAPVLPDFDYKKYSSANYYKSQKKLTKLVLKNIVKYLVKTYDLKNKPPTKQPTINSVFKWINKEAYDNALPINNNTTFQANVVKYFRALMNQ